MNTKLMPAGGFFQTLNHSLSLKLITTLSLLIFTGTAIACSIIFSTEKKNCLAEARSYLGSFSEVIKKSIRTDMLLVHRNEIQQTLESIVTSELVANVKILDHAGAVFYSSDPAEIGSNVDRNSPSCAVCHHLEEDQQSLLQKERQYHIYKTSDSARMLTYVEPIYNEPDCSTAVCHAHPIENEVLGIIMTDFSLKNMDSRIGEQIINTSVSMFILITLTALVFSFIMWKLVVKPLTSLCHGMEKVSAGNLLTSVEISSSDEIGTLAKTFNRMTAELNSAQKKMILFTNELEKEVEKKTKEIRKAQEKLIIAEKKAALSRMSADIAHEIRNPLVSLGGFGRRLQLCPLEEKPKRYAEIIVSESARLEKILGDVLTFSKTSQLSFKKLPVNGVIQDAVNFYKDLCTDQSIQIETDFGSDLPVLLDKDQLRQAIDNLLVNAIDAMPDGGSIRIVTALESVHHIQMVAIHITDSGNGIELKNNDLLFEPYYTTKQVGPGTGFGLPITKKIVEEHGGIINLHNGEHKGLTCSIFLPFQNIKDRTKIQCWDFMNCQRHKNAELKCPAYPHFGRACWAVAGTRCESKIQGTFAQKINSCKKCKFYRYFKDNKESLSS